MNIKSALAEMIKNDEFTKIADCKVYGKKERKKALEDRDMLNKMSMEFGGFDQIPFPILVTGISSREVLRGLVVYMATSEVANTDDKNKNRKVN